MARVLGQRLARDSRSLWRGTAPLVAGARVLLWFCTALWVPVLLIPGDTMTRSTTYATLRWVADFLDLPSVNPVLSPGELLLASVALALTTFSAIDYLRGNQRGRIRVWLATIFWIGVAASYVLANPLAYGTWLFLGFAALSAWCLRRVRAGG